MNGKLLLKMVFLLIIFLLLVLMGMNNKGNVALYLPPLLPKSLVQPAAMMYLGFFGIGCLCGALIAGGGGGKGGGGKSKG